MTNSPVAAGVGTQYVCMAGTVVSNDYTQVSPTNITLTLTNDATLTWQWQTNYWLTTATNGSGSVTDADGWYASGASTVLTATAATHWQFSHWSGDTNGCGIAGNELTAEMTRIRSITADFILRQYTVTVTSEHAVPHPGTESVTAFGYSQQSISTKSWIPGPAYGSG